MTGPAPAFPMRGRPQPSRDAVLGSDRLDVLRHPLASNLIGLLRDIDTPSAQFETAIHELTRYLIWRATEREPLAAHNITSFSGEGIPGTQFQRRMAALVVLRAGLSMIPPYRLLIPETPIYQMGIRRDETTLRPQLYYSNLPDQLSDVQHMLILDPMLATGGSARMALEQIRAQFAGDVSFLGLIGAPLGVQTLLKLDPHLRVYLASLDDKLNDRGYIMPGLGDAGDRLFGTN